MESELITGTGIGIVTVIVGALFGAAIVSLAAAAKHAYKAVWGDEDHAWFAWYPVRTVDRGWVWMQNVTRNLWGWPNAPAMHWRDSRESGH